MEIWAQEVHPLEVHPQEVHPVEVHPPEVHPPEVHPLLVVAGQKTPGGVSDDLKNQFDDAAIQTNRALAHIRAAQGRPGEEEGEDQSAAPTADDSPGEKVRGTKGSEEWLVPCL